MTWACLNPQRHKKCNFHQENPTHQSTLFLAALMAVSLLSYLESGGKSLSIQPTVGKGRFFFRKPLLQVDVDSPKLSLHVDAVPCLMPKVSSISPILLTPPKKKGIINQTLPKRQQKPMTRIPICLRESPGCFFQTLFFLSSKRCGNNYRIFTSCPSPAMGPNESAGWRSCT